MAENDQTPADDETLAAAKKHGLDKQMKDLLKAAKYGSRSAVRALGNLIPRFEKLLQKKEKPPKQKTDE